MKIEEIQQRIDDAKDRKSRAEGALDQIKKTWKDEFEVSSLEEAKALQAKYEKRLKTLSTRYETAKIELEEALEAIEGTENVFA